MPTAKVVPSPRQPGVQAYDPSANVLSLVEAAVTRLDDLRLAEMRRQDDIRTLTQDFNAQLREAESKRIDAIRAVDVNAVAVASSRASDQASVLAAQVQTSADALRSLVATSAATLAAQQSAAAGEFAKRLSELERSKYEGAGRSTVADPQMERTNALIEQLARSQATGAGKGAGLNMAWVLIGGAVSLVGGLLGIAGILYAVLK